MPSFSERAKRRGAARALQAARPAEQRYVRGLRGVVRGIHAVYMDYFLPRLSEVAKRQDGFSDYSGHLDMLGIHVAAQIPGKVGPLFDRMSHEVQKANARATYRLLGVAPNDTGIPSQIRAARDANIRLVEDAQRAYAEDVRAVFEDPDAYGLTADELKERLLDRGSVSESRAELIARDQTLKLNGAISQTRQQNAGVTSYVWSTANDERVREEHAALEGQTFDWTSPPAPGHPGEDYQCRCVALPVVDEFEGI